MKSILSILIIVAGLISLDLSAQEDHPTINLESIFKDGKFRSNSVGGYTSMQDGEHYLVNENDALSIYAYKNGKKTGTFVTPEVLIPEGDSLPVSLRRYSISLDESKILIPVNTERIYRRSSKSDYYVCDLDKKQTLPLSSSGKQQHATFSPNGRFVAFVRDNNLYISDLLHSTEKQITNDGEFNNIINGATDWVYEEEFGFSKAFFWSPDSKKIAFYRFDESEVKEFTMMLWGDLYPEPYQYKYPKAGEANALIEIQVYDLPSGSITKMDIGTETNIYIPRIKWTNDPTVLSIQRMNRLQNHLEILLADANSGKTETIYAETNKYYIDITDDLTFLKNSERFIISSEQDGFNHLYMFDLLGNLENQITSGEWDVDQFIGIDEENEKVYFTSSETSPLNRELYAINLDGSNKTRLSEKEGNNRIQFGKKFKYFMNTYSDAITPPIISLYKYTGEKIRDIENNESLVQTIEDYHFSPREFFTFETDDQISLNGWMIKPPDFDPNRKYPVLMYVYGGPGSQTVRNSWGGGNAWYQMLAAHGIIVVSVDNRGTGARGEAFKKMTYLELGKYETIDQIEAAKYLAGLDYIDPNRIGIWGWSYGGFMAASCITKGSDYFSTGIAVAPVTNWRYYDNIYTERFMRTPQENPEGYDNNSPINHVDQLKGNFLVIHGTADDNVHVQNTIDLVSALVRSNKQFEMQLYPNSNHGIYTGRNTTLHLYSRLTDFILKHLAGDEME
ncbi:MAG: DPP IV N-terminal domain-containing protein [Bacteroidetes bacterium]|nr:DPP IV N-terminal domain-containing protein [Bacteroidota bacterium]